MTRLKPYQSMEGMVYIGETEILDDLSSSVAIGMVKNAKGILVQVRTENVYFTVGDSDVVATTDDFFLSTTAIAPVFISIETGQYIAFLEAAPGAELIYHLVR